MKTTFRSKTFLLACVLCAGLVGIATAVMAGSVAAPEANPVNPERMALAKKYIATVPVETEIKAAIESMANQVPAEQRVLFRSIADKAIDYDRLRAAAEMTTAEMFTEKEIKAMTDFFGSPEGRSIRAKMPKYEERMQPVVNDVLQAFVIKLQENNVVPQDPATVQTQ